MAHEDPTAPLDEARQLRAQVEGRTRLVRAIGCGSSFGIEGKPLSYNWITWQPSAKTWTVSSIR